MSGKAVAVAAGCLLIAGLTAGVAYAASRKRWTSVYFTEEELGVDGMVGAPEWEAANRLATKLLDPIRSKLGKPVRVTSGYRSPEHNAQVGGAKNSNHLRGEAADIAVDGMSSGELAAFILDSGEDFDELGGYDAPDTHAHVALAGGGARELQWNGKQVASLPTGANT